MASSESNKSIRKAFWRHCRPDAVQLWNLNFTISIVPELCSTVGCQHLLPPFTVEQHTKATTTIQSFDYISYKFNIC
ncbi:hypothetical protein DMENIID0001_012000 [Sergentomyia squamirostris]